MAEGSNHSYTSDTFRIIPKEEVDKILQERQTWIDNLLKEVGEDYAPIVDTMRLKRHVSKGFTEFLIYIIKLFHEAIENKTICLKNSVRQNILSELEDHLLVLLYIREGFCGNDDTTTSLDTSIALVIGRAKKVTDIIQSLQKKHWLRWFRSAKNICALVPIFEKLTQVIEGIQHFDDCTEYSIKCYSKLLGDVEDLKASFHVIHKRVNAMVNLEPAGLLTGVILAFGGVICLIAGGILFFTPAAPAGIPLTIAGGAAVGIGVAIASGTKVCSSRAKSSLDHAETKGTGKGKEFTKNSETTMLMH